MIDFRFHLVSIVSIFLALAVGIVLGAGPLQEGLGSSLTAQVQQLRDEKDGLRSQLDDATKISDAKDQYAAAVAPDALKGKLAGQTVVVLTSTDTAGTFSQSVQRAIGQAGGTVTTVVTLKNPLLDPAVASERETLVRQLAPTVGVSAQTDSGDGMLAAVLARVLVRPPTSADDGTPVPGGVQALAGLKDAGFVDFTHTDLRRASLAVLISGPFSGPAEVVGQRSATALALARALDAGSSGMVVATGRTPTAAGQATASDLASVVRRDGRGAAAAITTVDHADSASGAGTVVLGLAGQVLGTAGHYGVAPDAKAVVPGLP